MEGIGRHEQKIVGIGAADGVMNCFAIEKVEIDWSQAELSSSSQSDYGPIIVTEDLGTTLAECLDAAPSLADDPSYKTLFELSRRASA